MKHILTCVVTLFIIGAWAKVDAGGGTTSIELDLNHLPDQYYSGHWGNIKVNDEELECMATDIYFEARGESYDGRRAIAEVVMYRMKHTNYPDTVCGVIKDGIYPRWDIYKLSMPMKYRCAFSWYCDRKSDVVIKKEIFKAAKELAIRVMLDTKYVPILDYALFYHAANVEPYWSETMTINKVIDNHVFY
jgi:spore germination cell wall hydrolase CwlJ-like protein